MKANNQRTLLELWPVIQDDLKHFVSDRPGWFISALEKATAYDHRSAEIPRRLTLNVGDESTHGTEVNITCL